MVGCSIPREIRRTLLGIGFAVAAGAAGLVLPLAAAPPALAADQAPPATNEQCLGCHGADGMEKKLGDGDTLFLHVPGDLFAKSVHSAIGCAGCHTDVDLSAHPPAEKDIASKRGFSLAMVQVCRGCHSDKFDQWDKSIHAALVHNGDPSAPVCTSCHNPHAVIKGAAAEIDQVPCKKCHTDIYTAYLGSKHAQVRRSSDQSYAPICFDCHDAHEVKPTSLGEGPEAACFGCHAGVLEAHQKWLPNAALHFQVVTCPACHSPGAQRKVDLMLIDSSATPRETGQIGVPLFQASAHSDAKGIDAQALLNLLQTLNRAGIADKTVLRGRLDVGTGPQAHNLADASKALSDCQVCHRKGSAAFQSVTISIVDADGRRVGYGANADVLNSPLSLASISGFYAIGANRIGLLDILLVLAVLGGLSVPVGHLALGWILKRYFPVPPAAGGRDRRPAGGAGPEAA